LTALNSGAAIIVDVRSTESFLAGHIAGALSIPLARIESTPTNLPLDKNQWIITYCT
jgi:rhodanese-related sulfurtransferase